MKFTSLLATAFPLLAFAQDGDDKSVGEIISSKVEGAASDFSTQAENIASETTSDSSSEFVWTWLYTAPESSTPAEDITSETTSSSWPDYRWTDMSTSSASATSEVSSEVPSVTESVLEDLLSLNEEAKTADPSRLEEIKSEVAAITSEFGAAITSGLDDDDSDEGDDDSAGAMPSVAMAMGLCFGGVALMANL